MTRFIAALIFVLLTLISSTALAEEAMTMFGIDISGTSTFLVDQNSANAAGAFVERYIAGLEAPHALALVSVGDEGLARRTINIRATVTKHRATSPRRLAPQFGGHVRSLPRLFAEGKIPAQNTTSLIAFFQSLEPVCKRGNATAIVFSDGLEWSAAVDGRAFAAGKIGLPKPATAFLKGCDVQLLGVGQVKEGLEAGGLAERLIPVWRDYLTEAGADTVTVIGSGFTY